MRWLDRLFGRAEGLIVRDGMCVFRRREIADYLRRPDKPNFGDRGAQTCTACGAAMPELLLTTGGPLGDPEIWRDVPLAVDGWGCVGCGVFVAPRKMTPQQISDFLAQGIEHGNAGRFADAEWCFTRVVWDWPGYAPGHGNLAEATRERLRVSPDLDEPLRRRLRARMRDEYRAAVAGYQGQPQAMLIPGVARAHLSLAELALEDRAFDSALRSLKECLELPTLAPSTVERARKLEKYIVERHDLFDAAAPVLQPYLALMDRASRPIETPDERARIMKALEDLERHYALAPDNWRAAWLLAKGRAAVDGMEATLDLWRRACAAHPGQRDIAREASLALLRTGHAAEALPIDRAITRALPDDATLWCNLAVCELLNGNLAEARAALAKSQALDPADSVANNVLARLVEYENGKPLPRSLAEMERG